MHLLFTITWAEVWYAAGWVVAALVLISKFFEDVFGIKAFGNKIYKGLPLMWKRVWGDATFKTEVSKQLGYIVHELKYNGGGSTKDAVKRIEHLMESVLILVDTCNRRMDIAEVSNGVMTFKTDAHGECKEINEVFLRKFGYLEGDVLGFAFENLVHEDDVERMRVRWQRAITSKSNFQDEQRIRKSNGEHLRCLVRASHVTLKDELVGFIGYIEIEKQTI